MLAKLNREGAAFKTFKPFKMFKSFRARGFFDKWVCDEITADHFYRVGMVAGSDN
jgi:hypothetical protein